MDLLEEDTDEEELLAAAVHFDSPHGPPAKRRSFEFGPLSGNINKTPISEISNVLKHTENRSSLPATGRLDQKSCGISSGVPIEAVNQSPLSTSSSSKHSFQGRTLSKLGPHVSESIAVLRNATSLSHSSHLSAASLRTCVMDGRVTPNLSCVSEAAPVAARASVIPGQNGKTSKAAVSSVGDFRLQPAMNSISAGSTSTVLRRSANPYIDSGPSDNAHLRAAACAAVTRDQSRSSAGPKGYEESGMFDCGEDEDDLLLSSACAESETADAQASQFRMAREEDSMHKSNQLRSDSSSGKNHLPSFPQSSPCVKPLPVISPCWPQHGTTRDTEWDAPVIGTSKDTPLQRGMKRKRKFPGPAGLLPSMCQGLSMDVKDLDPVPTPKRSIPLVPDVSPSQMTCSQSDFFAEAPWQMLKHDLEPQADKWLSIYSLKSITKLVYHNQLPKGKVPVLALVITHLNIHNADASVMVRDPSGEMRGTLHRQLVKEQGHMLQVGTAMLLRQVGVFSPSGRTHYLNITPNNVVCIYNRDLEGETQSSRLSSLLPADFSRPLPPQSPNQNIPPSPKALGSEGNVRPALFGNTTPVALTNASPGCRPRVPGRAPGPVPGPITSPHAVGPGLRFPSNSYKPRPPHVTVPRQNLLHAVDGSPTPRSTAMPHGAASPAHPPSSWLPTTGLQQRSHSALANQTLRYTTPARTPGPGITTNPSPGPTGVTPAAHSNQKSFSIPACVSKLASPQVDSPVPSASLKFSMPGELDDLLTGLEDEMMLDF